MDLFHPRHANSPLSFLSSDKSLLVTSSKKPVLIASSLPELDIHLALHKKTIVNKVALWVIIKSSDLPITGKEILEYFSPKHEALIGEEQSIDALVQLITDGVLTLYHWPYPLIHKQHYQIRVDKLETTSDNNKNDHLKTQSDSFDVEGNPPIINKELESSLNNLVEKNASDYNAPNTPDKPLAKLRGDLQNSRHYSLKNNKPVNQSSTKPANRVDTFLHASDLVSTKRGVTQSGLIAPAISHTYTIGEA